MSLYKVSQFIPQGSKLHQRQRAVVYDNNDPLKQGRVRANITGIFEPSDNGNHPWIYPHDSWHHTGNGKSANVNIPKIGSTLNVEFHNGSVYHGVYTGNYRSKNNTNNAPFQTENYPYVYGSVDDSQNSHVHDMKAGTYTYTHVAQSPNDPNNDEENTSQSSPPNATPKATHQYTADGSMNTNRQGSHNTSTAQNSTHTIGGTYSKTSSGDMSHSTSGTMSHVASDDIIHQASKIFLN